MPKRTTVMARQPPTTDDFKRIAESVRKISDVGKQLRLCGLSQRATITLLADSTGISRKDIGTVLTAIEQLRSWCLIDGNK